MSSLLCKYARINEEGCVEEISQANLLRFIVEINNDLSPENTRILPNIFLNWLDPAFDLFTVYAFNFIRHNSRLYAKPVDYKLVESVMCRLFGDDNVVKERLRSIIDYFKYNKLLRIPSMKNGAELIYAMPKMFCIYHLLGTSTVPFEFWYDEIYMDHDSGVIDLNKSILEMGSEDRFMATLNYILNLMQKEVEFRTRCSDIYWLEEKFYVKPLSFKLYEGARESARRIFAEENHRNEYPEVHILLRNMQQVRDRYYSGRSVKNARNGLIFNFP